LKPRSSRRHGIAITYVNFGLRIPRRPGATHARAMTPRTYRVTVDGDLSDPTAARAFGDLTLAREHGTTVLVCPVHDQAELHRLLRQVSALGLTLLSAKVVEEGER
jgi:hypothetical protein